MLRAIRSIVNDEIFQVELEPAKTAFKQAASVLKWATQQENQQTFHDFKASIKTELKKCFPDITCSTGIAKALQSQRG